ncbi:hypothetical protein Tsubulata_022036 [Turnera subulata]|uniref:Nucleoprotein TPR/MLP1 domain-containing protein n=1 Tax=Turnera subulata TaxID=218843 RepID=A0A9Q0FSD0_9ROSI|nr:hypothetical protein Tsubulata_022036 [Turnera subulata]
MPLFISEDELASHSSDAPYVAAKADEFIRALQTELETVRAKADAEAITAEQTCSLLEQKFLSLSADFSRLESEKAQLESSLKDRNAELAQAQTQNHQLQLQLVISTSFASTFTFFSRILEVQKDGEKERLTTEVAELHKSKRQLLELVEQKDSEISEKNATINSYLDKIVNLTDSAAKKETRLSELEQELGRLQASCARLSQEISKSKDAAAANEARLSAELSTVNKLVDLYKENSEEWSRKAGELEGVIKALETHLHQVENDYKGKLESEVSARKQLEKEAADLKEKLERFEVEAETSRKANEQNLLPLGSLTLERHVWVDPFDGNDMAEDANLIVPKIPVGVSGTALAASLLRDGWSLAKMYAKYQEAVDALRHEQLGRKESEAVLQRVLCELEEKAGVILDERAEYERMVESYSVINQKLQHSISERANIEKTIQELQVDLRKRERDYNLAQKEIDDLQKQVTVLIKECRDVQLRCGSMGPDQADDDRLATVGIDTDSDVENVLLERLLTFKDINGLVEQNVKLRTLVRDLSDQIESKEKQFQERLDMELKKHTDEAAVKVGAVLQRAEEQGRMIESLHTSVAMYKRLYEEEHKLQSSYSRSSLAAPVAESGRKDLLLLLEGSQEATKKAQEKTVERLRSVEEDLAKSKSDNISLRSERDRLALEAKFAREKLDSFMKEFEHQRNELNGVLARNVEFSQLIVDYQKKLRESSDAVHASEELTRKLTMEVSILKSEKEMLSNAERRACDEVRSLSERVHRLQASLDTIQSAEEVREEARAAERRKQEEYVKRVEREWAEAKKELQQERDNVRALTSDREQTMKNAMKQVEEMGKELANALHAVSDAETRAAVAETKLSDLERKYKTLDSKVADRADSMVPSSVSTTEVVTDLLMAKEELQKLKEEAQANMDHMLQYKSIAQVNETALKQMEAAHENFKNESQKLKDSLDAEVLSLRERITVLENELTLKSEEVATASAGKEEAFTSTLAEITRLKEENSTKISTCSSQIEALEIQVSALKDDLEKEHERWRAAQANYERQVILQSETIQELTKTSKALASVQEEASELRRLVDAQKCENGFALVLSVEYDLCEMYFVDQFLVVAWARGCMGELRSKWEVEKSMLEESKSEAERKYNELNEQNKILHSRLEALHIQLAERDRQSAGISGSTTLGGDGDAGLQNVVNYLRRSKEIAETEISLLKQEKLRLQSQLETALKEAETAQASLNAQRANTRALLLSEEEIKSLQFQVREMNLLRESNMQLREENKHNFEECQKLRDAAQKAKAESDNLASLLREKQIEVEACRKEIEMERIEKEQLEKRLSELLERSRNVDVKDYEQMKNDIRQMQGKLKSKESDIEEVKSIVSKQLETISKLEEDLSKTQSELNQREKRISDILQTEANLKTEFEKQKKLTIQWKKKSDTLLKERDESSKEKQTLAKQIEDLKQGKRSVGSVSGEQVLREKEERDQRIQMLERTVERQREDLRKEKEDLRKEKLRRQVKEKEILDTLNKVKAKLENDLVKHRQALKRISDELEKLKQAEGNLPEFLSGTTLDELAAAYVSAIENIEGVTRAASVELGSSSLSAEATSSAEAGAVTPGQAVSSQVSVISLAGPTSHLASKAEEKERKSAAAKPHAEPRKTGRKLVRPKLLKPEEPQGDVEMPDAEATNSGKLAPSSESDMQRSTNLTSQPAGRKRLAPSATDPTEEQPLNQGDNSSDATEPVVKRPKSSDAQEGAENQFATPEAVATLPFTEHSSDAGDPSHVTNEEAVEKEEVETIREKDEIPKEFEHSDDMNQVEPQNEKNDATDDILDKPSGSTEDIDDASKDQGAMEDNQQAMEFESEKEEGELVPDAAEVEETADASNITGSPEIGEGVPDVGTTPIASPARTDVEGFSTGGELSEMKSPEALNDDKNEEGELIEEATEGSDKSNDGNDQAAAETDQTPEVTSNTAAESTVSNASAEVDVSKQAGSSTTEAEDGKQISPAGHTSRVVNLAERAKERAMLRQSGAGVLSPSGSRGRGRAIRGRAVRGARGGRGGRGQAPSPQG